MSINYYMSDSLKNFIESLSMTDLLIHKKELEEAIVFVNKHYEEHNKKELIPLYNEELNFVNKTLILQQTN